MRFIASIYEKLQRHPKRVVFPEGAEPRVLQAARQFHSLRLGVPILLGDRATIKEAAERLNVTLEGVRIINPAESEDLDSFVRRFELLRRLKGIKEKEARDTMIKPNYYGAMMVGDGVVDGMVTGSNSPTRDTVRAALFGVGLAPGNNTVSSCSVMNTIVPELGVDGSLIFADTGVVPEPTAEQLADIAILAAEACRNLLETEPFVAMISFSTKGSASSPAVDKVIEATRLAQSRRPDLNIDGEMQVDAAVIPDIGQRKAKGSKVAGRANTLVFPDLSCGNSAYKLVERFGKATALGPLLLGPAKPVNDLSRGCSIEDIVLITAITAVQGLK